MFIFKINQYNMSTNMAIRFEIIWLYIKMHKFINKITKLKIKSTNLIKMTLININ